MGLVRAMTAGWHLGSKDHPVFITRIANQKCNDVDLMPMSPWPKTIMETMLML